MEPPKMAVADMEKLFGPRESGEYRLANHKDLRVQQLYKFVVEAVWLKAKTITISAGLIAFLTAAEKNVPIPWAELFFTRFTNEVLRLSTDSTSQLKTKVGQLLSVLFALDEPASSDTPPRDQLKAKPTKRLTRGQKAQGKKKTATPNVRQLLLEYDDDDEDDEPPPLKKRTKTTGAAHSSGADSDSLPLAALMSLRQDVTSSVTEVAAPQEATDSALPTGPLFDWQTQLSDISTVQLKKKPRLDIPSVGDVAVQTARSPLPAILPTSRAPSQVLQKALPRPASAPTQSVRTAAALKSLSDLVTFVQDQDLRLQRKTASENKIQTTVAELQEKQTDMQSQIAELQRTVSTLQEEKAQWQKTLQDVNNEHLRMSADLQTQLTQSQARNQVLDAELQGRELYENDEGQELKILHVGQLTTMVNNITATTAAAWKTHVDTLRQLSQWSCKPAATVSQQPPDDPEDGANPADKQLTVAADVPADQPVSSSSPGKAPATAPHSTEPTAREERLKQRCRELDEDNNQLEKVVDYLENRVKLLRAENARLPAQSSCTQDLQQVRDLQQQIEQLDQSLIELRKTNVQNISINQEQQGSLNVMYSQNLRLRAHLDHLAVKRLYLSKRDIDEVCPVEREINAGIDKARALADLHELQYRRRVDAKERKQEQEKAQADYDRTKQRYQSQVEKACDWLCRMIDWSLTAPIPRPEWWQQLQQFLLVQMSGTPLISTWYHLFADFVWPQQQQQPLLSQSEVNQTSAL